VRAAKSRCRYARRCFTTRRRLSGLAYRGADVFGGKNWTLLNCGDWSTGPSFWQLARAHIGVALARAVPRSGPIFYPYGRSQPLVDRLHRMAGSFLKEASAIAEGDMPGGSGTETQPTTDTLVPVCPLDHRIKMIHGRGTSTPEPASRTRPRRIRLLIVIVTTSLP